jgi:hypothetical protein
MNRHFCFRDPILRIRSNQGKLLSMGAGRLASKMLLQVGQGFLVTDVFKRPRMLRLLLVRRFPDEGWLAKRLR